MAAAGPAQPNAAPPKAGRSINQTGTGFVVSATGHVVTNQHVINGCTGDILGNLTGEATVKLRLVSSDKRNDLALLQAPGPFKEIATIRDKPMHSGDSVVAIGYPLYGLLTSDFTVTTGIVSSSGVTSSSSSHAIGADTCAPLRARTDQAPNTVLCGAFWL